MNKDQYCKTTHCSQHAANKVGHVYWVTGSTTLTIWLVKDVKGDNGQDAPATAVAPCQLGVVAACDMGLCFAH